MLCSTREDITNIVYLEKRQNDKRLDLTRFSICQTSFQSLCYFFAVLIVNPKADAEDYIQLVPAKTGSFQ